MASLRDVEVKDGQVSSIPSTIKEVETDRTNPEYIGPGHWDAMHKDSFNCLTPDSQKGCCLRIRDTCNTFNCKTCRGHCIEYIKNNPPEDYIGKTWKDDSDGTVYQLGIAVWAWKFHNAVNFRLGKPQMRWDACFKIYTTLPEHCSAGCSEGEKTVAPSSNKTEAETPKTTVPPTHSYRPWYPGLTVFR